MFDEDTAVGVIPAYGRRYATIEAAVADWNAGRDFKLVGGPYCSIRDAATLKAEGFDRVKVIIPGTEPGVTVEVATLML